jgi:hypothetical protein
MKHPDFGWPGTISTNGHRRWSCRPFVLALAGVVPVLAIAIGCGGKESTASKSASAFDDAVKKGESPGIGEAHGGHGAASSGAENGHAAASPSPPAGEGSMAGMDHSKMPGMGQSAGMETMDHATAPGGKRPGMTGMDHSAMPGMKRGGASGTKPSGMAGMDHSAMPGMRRPGTSTRNQSAMAGMDHSGMTRMNHGAVSGQAASAAAGGAAPNTMSGMGHGMAAMGQTTAPAPLPPEPPVAVAQPGQPAALLRQDPIDAPVPTAVMDATRAAAMAAEMASGGMAMSHVTYRQVDAGRDVVRAPMPMTGGHEGHQMAPSTAAPMAPAAHGAHGQPAPAPSSTSGGKPTAPSATPAPAHQHETAPPKTSVSPPPDPHRMHAAPSPRPQPSPSPGGNQ